MLRELTISNFVLIRELQFKPASGLNIITGETGAGKSILLGALELIIGKRADTSLLQDVNEKCVIEGHFDLSALQLEPWFEAQGLDYDPFCIIRREILPNGRSRAFVNDTPVLLPVLRELADQLLDIHSQNSSLNLADPGYLFDWYDLLCGTFTERQRYSALYDELRTKKDRLEKLRTQSGQDARERDLDQFLLDELIEAKLKADELQNLEQRLELLSMADTIRDSAEQAYAELNGEEGSILDRLNSVLSALPQVGGEDLRSRLKGNMLEIQDISAELRQLAENTVSDPAELQQVEERIGTLHKLMRKHKVQDMEALIAIRESIDQRLQEADNRSEDLSKLEAEIAETQHQCIILAEQLHAKRLEAAQRIALAVQEPLRSLGLPHAEIRAMVLAKEQLGPYGSTQLEIHFSANKGSAPEPLTKVASGGEFSRLMLVVKSLLARHKALPTIIFDEIDTGVSGEAALRMADMLGELSKDLQVISITHLPQIAARGNKHFLVYKTTKDVSTQTALRILEGEDRVLEIAKMASGDRPGAASMEHARSLLRI